MASNTDTRADTRAGRRWDGRYSAGPAEMVRYAAATGNFYPLHHDPGSREARAMGGTLVPGRYRMGCVARCILDELPGARLVSLTCEYVGPAPVGEDIHVLIRVVEERDDELRLRVATRDPRGRINLRGHARVRLEA